MKKPEETLLQELNARSQNTLMETLNIRYTAIGEDFVEAEMPVGPKVYQPDGVLHGGATVALAETVGSVASAVLLDNEHYFVRGIAINANHIKSVRAGKVIARAEFLHKGRTTQVWDIRIRDEKDQLISVVKLTTIALPRKK